MNKKRLFSLWTNIKLVDRYLIVIMTILMIYSTTTLLITESNISTEVANACDVVIRTTIASIFGYFISSNFATDEKKINIKNYNLMQKNNNNICEKENDYSSPNNNLQTTIISVICITTLLIMTYTRFFSSVDSKGIAILSQFRDIVCGSIGYLIGIPPSGDRNNDS